MPLQHNTRSPAQPCPAPPTGLEQSILVPLGLPGAQILSQRLSSEGGVEVTIISSAGRAACSRCGRMSPKQHDRRLRRKREENLTPEEEAARAQVADMFPDLAAAWRHKEALRRWYATARSLNAAAGLDDWMAGVRQEGPAELVQTLSAFRTWRTEILAFFASLPTRLSNGFVEGKNNRTKALMRQAYGYRNQAHLRLRILLEVA